MVKKKTANIQQTKSGTPLIVVGIIALISSLFSSNLISVFGTSVCSKNSFGNCTLDSRLFTGILSTYVPYLIAAVGLFLVVYGVISITKGK